MSDSPATPLAEALADGVVLLDGGLSNQLEDQGSDLADELWSARLLAEDPAQIEAAHAAYVRAGARVLITSSYQASFEGFARRGLGAGEARRLFGRSVGLARSAARTPVPGRPGNSGDSGAPGPVWVAGSVGPYGAVLADGSEYRGRYGLGVRELAAFHRPRVAALAAAGPDVLALETVPDATEAEALLDAVAGCGVPVWLSFTVAGGRTRAGGPLAEAFAVASGNPQVLAVGVNCCAAEEVGPALETAARMCPGTPLVAYPNSGEGWDARRAAWAGTPTFAPALAREWVALGARLVGGCCRVGPDAIAALGRAVQHP
ncbi:homocysteine S-methyltransferase [Streptomyces axinellae]|uniref:Homocysteine S-methyltransferase n=1 Tax=Streptomyces axinellae TaxID=552788 RepID=A0ABN3QH04_9ACTN